MMRFVFLIFFAVLCSKGVWAQFKYDRIPIIAFIGVPASQTNEERFKEFREAGFDVSINSYPDKHVMRKAMDIAQKTGVSLMLHCPELTMNPEKTAREFSSHPSLFAYYIADEPNKADLKSLHKIVHRINAVDSLHSCYVNMLPFIDDYSLKLTQFDKYDKYLEAVSKMDLHFLSFDFYPITTKGIRKNWYKNLEMVRKQSQKVNKPFYAFVLSTPHVVYPMPTQKSLLLQINANLAYGAQALQYYTYWTPRPDGKYDYNNGPISNDGKRTKTYRLVSEVNRSILPYLYLFYNAKINKVSHLGVIPEGTRKIGQLPEYLRDLSVKGEEGAIFSEFEKGGFTYFCVVNKDYNKTATLRLRYNSKNVMRLVPNGGRFELKDAKEIYTLRPSEMMVFRAK